MPDEVRRQAVGPEQDRDRHGRRGRLHLKPSVLRLNVVSLTGHEQEAHVSPPTR